MIPFGLVQDTPLGYIHYNKQTQFSVIYKEFVQPKMSNKEFLIWKDKLGVKKESREGWTAGRHI
jgi:hypothetical protein